MEKKAVCAFLIGCRAEEFMAYRDVGEDGAVVVGPDGRKHVFDAAYLAQAERKAKAARPRPGATRSGSSVHAPKPKPKPKAKPETKRQTTTKRKPRK